MLEQVWNKLRGSGLLGSAGVYASANVLNGALAFALMPVLTRYLSPSDYGIVGLFVLAAGFVDPFVSLGVHAAVARRYYERERIDLPAYVTTAVGLASLSTLAVAALLLLSSPLVTRVTFLPTPWILGIAGLAWGNTLCNVILALLQVQERPRLYAAFQVTRTVVNLGVSVALVVGLGMGWEGRAWGLLVAGGVFGGVALIGLWRGGQLVTRVGSDHARHMLAFGVPLIPHALGGIVLAMTDRFFLGQMVGIAEVGIYTVGYQLGNIIGLLQDAFNKAWVPWLYARLKADEPGIRHALVRVTYVYDVAILIGVVLLALLAPPLLSVFVGERFAGAAPYVLWIGLGFAFDGMYKMVANYIFYAEKTHLLAYSTGFAAVVNVPLTYVMIRFNGALGAAQSTAIASALLFLITWRLSQSVFPMPWRLRERG